MDDFSGTRTRIAFVIRRQQRYQAIFDEDVSVERRVRVLQTRNLRATSRLARCDVDQQQKSFQKGINLFAILAHSLLIPHHVSRRAGIGKPLSQSIILQHSTKKPSVLAREKRFVSVVLEEVPSVFDNSWVVAETV